ncbi:MAG: alcohol dehydrogenase catalytic domain-containing protein [Candidatus Anammoximicrobium sp.]|nr:alcohol dehydrogenase catalytic domain-containing protein [Candidatus Anammoximicrobium sp.]
MTNFQPTGALAEARVARAAVFSGVGRPLELRSIPVADPQEGEILVRVVGCTLCGSDVHTYTGKRSTPLPTILGHEILGRIVAFGPAAARRDARGTSLHEGDRVTWALVASCGACFYCRRGLPQKCLCAVKYGHEPLHEDARLRGGLADYCLLAPGTAVVRLEDALSDEAACPANCGTATMVAATEAAGDMHGGCVVVLGAGLLGLTACALARSRGAADVILCDVQSPRLARGAAFGATRVAAPGELGAAAAGATQGHGVDVVIDSAGTPEAFESGLALLRLGGAFILVGAVFPTRPVELHVERVVRRNLRLCGIHNYAPEHLVKAVAFLEQSKHPWHSLVADWLPLSECTRTFQRAQDPAVLRIGVRP